MSDTLLERVNAYQRRTFRELPNLRVTTINQAVEFVNERGFIFFWPLKGLPFPSLWSAVAGNRPVADEHDDPGHITWGWKDSLLGTKRLYYSKLIKHRNTFISNQLLPNFYALSPNYGDFETDYLVLYSQGSLSSEAKALYESLLFNGPLDTLSLRKSANLSSAASSARYTQAIDKLQSDFMVMPIGISRAGAWNYAYTYDITARHLPELIDQTRFIDDDQARKAILTAYITTMGCCDKSSIRKLFSWDDEYTAKILNLLELDCVIQKAYLNPEDKKEIWVLPEFTC